MQTNAFILFHLNLGFSTLEVRDRSAVIERCYEPLLELAETGRRPLALEASGWTLTQLSATAPRVINRLRSLLDKGKVEFVGSGWAQVIGPLVPNIVNVRNQSLGLDAYNEILGTKPKVALVNEMTFSAGLVDVYADSGYSGVILDRENARAAIGVEDQAADVAPKAVQGPLGSLLPVVWSDTVLFQRFQRVVHGEISLDDYLSILKIRVAEGQKVLPIYTNDAEVFGYRPGRFMTEPAITDDEWRRIGHVLDAVDAALDPEWVTPSQLLTGVSNGDALAVTNIASPVIVKKQRKYNFNRWALSGRDDLRLNTAAHRVTRATQAAGWSDDLTWREVCEWWASDLRTHLADSRWEELLPSLDEQVPVDFTSFSERLNSFKDVVHASARIDENVKLEGDDVHVELDTRRGGVIKALAFRSHGWDPCVGTVPQGSLNAIDVAVDFYTGSVVVDLPDRGRRLTNLAPCLLKWNSDAAGHKAQIVSGQTLDGEPLAMTTIEVPRHGEKALIRIELAPARSRGSVRVGHLTLLPGAFSPTLWVETMLGGAIERFPVDRNVDHGAAVSLFVSSATSLGGASGMIRIGDETRMLEITWDPSECAAIPMLHHRRVGDRFLTRLIFSLSEIDDTFRAGGTLLPLAICIRPG
jgi:hypothetical protein